MGFMGHLRILLLLSLGAPAAAGEAALAGQDLAAARADYETLCSACHGPAGRGDGPQAESLQRRPADLTQIAGRNGGVYPEQAVFDRIAGLAMADSHGSREMPVWGDILIGEAVGGGTDLAAAEDAAAAVEGRIRRLAKYLETIQAAAAAAPE